MVWGLPPEPYHRNNSETMTEMIKDQVQYQESELPEFIEVSCIGERHKGLLRKAVARTGETKRVQNDLTTEGSPHER